MADIKEVQYVPHSITNTVGKPDYIPDPETIYQNVYKLLPGHSLQITDSGHRLRKYWEPSFAIDPAPDLPQAVKEIRALAQDCVSCRMISDVPLGAFLSGGIDSSAAVAFMAGHASEPVKTFSIGFTNKRFDELKYARLIADRYQTSHREQVVSPSVHEMLGTLVEHFDEPFGDSSAIPTLYLTRMTRAHVVVALCGDGADELFGGYRRYLFGVLEDRLRSLIPGWLQRPIGTVGRYYPKFDYLPRVFRAKTLLTNLAQQIGDAYFTSMTAFRDSSLETVLSDNLKKSLGGYSPRESYRERFEAVRDLPPLQQMQAVDMVTYLPGDILVKTDRATMAYSLEARAPWLDYRMAELACRLPTSFKLQGKVGKFAFKQAVAQYVPAAILRRSKMGFSVPLGQWLRTNLKPTFERLVLNAAMEEYLSLKEVRRLWREHQSGYRHHDEKLWNLLMFAGWEARHKSYRDVLSELRRDDIL